jgi:hypothetical protein
LPDHFHSQSPGARLVLGTILSHGRAPYIWRPSRITKSGNPIVVPTFSHAISAKNLTLNRPSYFVRERLRHSQSVVSRPWWNARRPERPALTRKSTRTCCGIAAVTNWRMTASIREPLKAIWVTGQFSTPYALFRSAGVTTLAIRPGDKPHAGGALLHHRPGPATQENYNRASCMSAGKALFAVNKSYRRK